MNLLLIGNYTPDRQRSMLQYEQLLVEAAEGLGWQVECWHPTVRYGSKVNTLSGLGKLAGYFDKYVLTPLTFRRRWARLTASEQQPDFVHIVDHSNAPYAPYFQGVPVLVTCHDLIAVRRARGEFAPACPRSRITARWQQHWILNALKRVPCPGFVSQASKNDFIRLTGREEPAAGWPILFPASAQPLEVVPTDVAAARLSAAALKIRPPFIHHHGGATWYKNREAVIDVFLKCRIQMPKLSLVLSGGKLSSPQQARLEQSDALEAVVDCGAVTTEVLSALYSTASVFLFPSWYEGFGWPPVEAQACGCPVVASNAGSLAEVLDDSAALFEPGDIEGMSEAVMGLIQNSQQSRALIEKGFKNAERFTFEQLQSDYKTWGLAACGPLATTK